ncbi:Arm DNA-binding domain-containing protein [Filomicrobium sp.]|uniref:Arm DNA-binding domain-containing protein n=1 Tax=Filomicrobium sp. TaxID=2024831 RepID=UPI002585DE57|nr:Arm DNA-binding domain-containing protein [Filomicrobium sp.]
MQTNGSRLWRLAYRFAGKQKTFALGSYPTVSLQKAREGRDAAKRLLAEGGLVPKRSEEASKAC